MSNKSYKDQLFDNGVPEMKAPSTRKRVVQSCSECRRRKIKWFILFILYFFCLVNFFILVIEYFLVPLVKLEVMKLFVGKSRSMRGLC